MGEGEAREACLSDLKGSVSFCLQGLEKITMWRGSEASSGDLAWAGLAYGLPPNIQTFDYNIHLFDRCQEREESG